jgi:hypothetical protein
MSPTTSWTGSVTCCSIGSTEPALQPSTLADQRAADRPVRTQAAAMPLCDERFAADPVVERCPRLVVRESGTDGMLAAVPAGDSIDRSFC